MSLKSFKTPLRYPGGKSRACKKMEPFIPDLRDYEVYYEPFLGGGSVALHITKKYPKLKIVVNDLYEPYIISGYSYKLMEIMYIVNYNN